MNYIHNLCNFYYCSLLECKTGGTGKFTHDYSLVDDGEISTANMSSSEVFNDLMSMENIKQESMSTNPFLDNEVNNTYIFKIISRKIQLNSYYSFYL